ncbi:unnamed protein product [Notodromas monacha]|uniref:Uncharacterized protein n=1 Tax=Notodromas monacha TaxID=399045 RepID=A0A7R9BY24_9CRUS|nr:unnamed protein product [Notodromas monacha]CAG0923852.1 unnamed protein product [Notodromas monacha]
MQESRACTLIAVALACRIIEQHVMVKDVWSLSNNMATLEALFLAMIDGNALHRRLHQQRLLPLDHTLSIPSAISAISLERPLVTERFFAQILDLEIDASQKLQDALEHCLTWFQNQFPLPHRPNNLGMIWIVDKRSMLLLYQTFTGMVTLFDSHRHSSWGAAIAQVPVCRLPELCDWYCEQALLFFGSRPSLSEISCVVSVEDFNYSDCAYLLDEKLLGKSAARLGKLCDSFLVHEGQTMKRRRRTRSANF